MRTIIEPRTDRGNRRPINPVAGRKLRQWIAARVNVLSPEIRTLFEQLHRFAREIETDGFDSVSKKLSSDQGKQSDLTKVVQEVVEALCKDIEGGEQAIARKSLQEVFYVCTGLDPSLQVPIFGARLQVFLRSRGGTGLIRLFLKFYLFNLVWAEFQDSLQGSSPRGHALKKEVEEIERICQSTADATVKLMKRFHRTTVRAIR